jgi:hypothetical protein
MLKWLAEMKQPWQCMMWIDDMQVLVWRPAELLNGRLASASLPHTALRIPHRMCKLLFSYKCCKGKAAGGDLAAVSGLIALKCLKKKPGCNTILKNMKASRK